MALTKSDKEFIELTIRPIQLDIKTVKEHLIKINGTVHKHEDVITQALIERTQNREHAKHFENSMSLIPSKVENLEKNMFENKITKKFIVKVIGITSIVISIIVAVVQLVGHFIG